MNVGNYTPHRKKELFLDENGKIKIVNSNDAFHLIGIGRIIWYMLDGKHTVNNIVMHLCHQLNLCEDSFEQIQFEVITILDMLQKRDAIIVNWDPLYKFTLCQELYNES
jgi:hypothetical protein